jgi:hypothetical protein
MVDGKLVISSTPSAVSPMHSSRACSLLAGSVGEGSLEFKHGAGNLVAHASLATGSSGCRRRSASCTDTASACSYGRRGGSGFGTEQTLLEGGLCASCSGSPTSRMFHGGSGGRNGGTTGVMASTSSTEGHCC